MTYSIIKKSSYDFNIINSINYYLLLGAASPGPSLVLVSKNAILNGKFSGSLTGFGHGIGIFIYAFLSIISIGVINDINTLLIDIITIVLVGYMLFLAFRIYKDRKANTENNSNKALFQNFYDGFLICFLNPKITVFFLQFFLNWYLMK